MLLLIKYSLIVLLTNTFQTIHCGINERLEKIERRLEILEGRAAFSPMVIPIPKEGRFSTLEGKPIILKCLVEGNPTPTIKWIRNETILSENKEEFKIEISNRNDTGSYECLVDNKVGPMKIRKFNVQILHIPTILAITQKIKTGPGRSVKLICQSESNPEPQFKWMKSGREINNQINKYSIITKNRSNTEFETSLSMSQINVNKDFGEYKCQATNKIGHSNVSKIIVFGQIPIIMKVSTEIYENSTTIVLFKTKILSVTNPIKIKVQFKRKKERSWFENVRDLKEFEMESIDENINATIYKIQYSMDFLYVDTEFELRMAFYNEFGWSEYKKIFLHTAYVCGSEMKLRSNWQVLVSHREFGNEPYPLTVNCKSKLSFKKGEIVEFRFTYFNLDDHKYEKESRYMGSWTEHNSCIDYHHFKIYFLLTHSHYHCMISKPELRKIMILNSGFFPYPTYSFRFNKENGSPYSGKGFRLEFKRKNR